MNYKSYSSKSNQPADGSVHWVDVARPILDIQLGLMFGCGSCLVFLMPYAKDKPIGLYQYVQSYNIHIMYVYIYIYIYIYICICRNTHKEPMLITKTHRCIIFRCFHRSLQPKWHKPLSSTRIAGEGDVAAIIAERHTPGVWCYTGATQQ